MSTKLHVINERNLYGDLISNSELYTPTKHQWFELTTYGLLNVKGENAAQFLQGQISCNIHEVSASQIRHAVLANLKGRIMALLTVMLQKDQYFLLLPDDILNDTQNSLLKPAMFSKVTVEKTSHYSIYGFRKAKNLNWPFKIQEPKSILEVQPGETYLTIKISSDCYYFIYDTTKPDLLSQAQDVDYYQDSAWHQVQVLEKNIEIYPSTRGMFLPHRLNLHNMGYLNFDKGCYKGQEIIARTHFRAKIKHELQLFFIETKENLFAGQKISTQDNQQEIGALVDFAPLENDHNYIILLSILSSHPQVVHFENHDASLNLNTSSDQQFDKK